MNGNCRLEPDVIRAASTGAWSESLRSHLAICPDCAAAAEVGPWMEGFAQLDDRRHILPDPAVLWLKAKLLQSTADVQRAALPMTRLQIAAYLVVAACWAALLNWKWASVQAWVNGLTPNHVILSASGAESSTSLSLTLLIGVVLLGSATFAIAMHTILAEE